MKNTLFIILTIFCSGTFAQNEKSQLVQLKEEALNFSLLHINTYFSEDCDSAYSMMSEQLILMDGDGIYGKSENREELCNSLKRANRDKQKTFDDYLEAYQIDILTPKETKKKLKVKFPVYYIPAPTDYFLIGYELKKSSTTENFIWDDLFVFMVRKENNKWCVKGISG